MRSTPATTSKTRLPSSSEPWKPHAYMKRGVKFLLNHAAAVLFLDLGLGKTSIVLATLKLLFKIGAIHKALVIAPLRVAHSVWPAEVVKWKDFEHLRVVVLHGDKKDELLASDADLYVINPEGLEWLLKPTKKVHPATGKVKITVDARAFKKLGFDVVVYDELTKFKNQASVRFKMWKQVVGTFGRRWGLTATPSANGLLGLFGQLYVVDEGRSLGKYITAYRQEYFVPSRDGFNWEIQEGGEQRIYKRLAPLALRMSNEDYHDLPMLIENEIRIDLPDDARAIYDALQDDLVARIQNKTITAKNAGVSLGKCRQVAGGAIYEEAGLGELMKIKRDKKRDWIHVHDAKLDALEDVVEELQGSPLLIVYEFQHELERLKFRFGKHLPFIGAGVNVKRGKELEDAWNRGELPLLAVHPQSVAYGLNMQKGGYHLLWYTLTWDRELVEQLVGRLRRQGSVNKRIFVHYLIARNTVDELVLGSSKAKGRGQQALFTGLQTLQRGLGRPKNRKR